MCYCNLKKKELKQCSSIECFILRPKSKTKDTDRLLEDHINNMAYYLTKFVDQMDASMRDILTIVKKRNTT